jgi:hypothetical protein
MASSPSSSSSSLSALLNEVFFLYAESRPNGETGIVSSMFIKLCQDADLFNNHSFGKQEAELIFSKLKGYAKFRLDVHTLKVN